VKPMRAINKISPIMRMNSRLLRINRKIPLTCFPVL
jgi:hypothetical protein